MSTFCGSRHAIAVVVAVLATLIALLPGSPAEAGETILRPDGTVTDTGYFPIAVWLQQPYNASNYQAAGINLYVGLWDGPTQSQLDDLLSAGMNVICDQNALALAGIATYGDIIVGWMHNDEPDNAQWNEGSQSYDPCVDTSVIRALYDGWVAGDSTRPVYLNLGQGVSYIDWVGRGTCTGNTGLYPGYLRGCDIVSYDIYPVNSSYAEVQGNLWYVPKGVDSLRVWGSDQKPVWCWIECTRIDESGEAPTPSEVKTEVWMALIHGARGFGYFCHSWYPSFTDAGWLDNTAMNDTITAVNTRVSALAPVLNSPSVSSAVAVVSSDPSAPIDFMVKQHGGSTYIFAVVMRDNPATGTFTIQGLSGSATAEVLDEQRSISVEDGSFQDSFAGYEVHLYRIDAESGVRQELSGNGTCNLHDHGSRVSPGHTEVYSLCGRRIDVSRMQGTGTCVVRTGQKTALRLFRP